MKSRIGLVVGLALVLSSAACTSPQHAPSQPAATPSSRPPVVYESSRTVQGDAVQFRVELSRLDSHQVTATVTLLASGARMLSLGEPPFWVYVETRSGQRLVTSGPGQLVPQKSVEPGPPSWISVVPGKPVQSTFALSLPADTATLTIGSSQLDFRIVKSWDEVPVTGQR